MSENFWIFFLSSVIALLLIIFKLCFKSKCTNISISWSGLAITRDVEEEHDSGKVDV